MHSALARIAGEGPVRFDRFQSDALYAHDGFYAAGGAAGRGGDFVTAVEVGSEFARCVAHDLDRRWRKLGNPEPFIVVEGGSGVGTLCADVFTLGPDCGEALRWVMVERSDLQRTTAMKRLAAEVFSATSDLPVAAVRDIAQMTLHQSAHVVLANELLDNLATRVVRRADSWQELFVALEGEHAVPLWCDLDASSTRRAQRHGAAAAPGAAFPLADHAVQWVVRARALLADGGSLLVFDYGATTAELAQRGLDGWLRTYVGHSRGVDPFDDVGAQDITVDVAFDQLPGRPSIDVFGDWLAERGMSDRREVAAAAVDAATVDAAGLVARSHLAEFDALLDPSSIGGFSVATWDG